MVIGGFTGRHAVLLRLIQCCAAAAAAALLLPAATGTSKTSSCLWQSYLQRQSPPVLLLHCSRTPPQRQAPRRGRAAARAPQPPPPRPLAGPGARLVARNPRPRTQRRPGRSPAQPPPCWRCAPQTLRPHRLLNFLRHSDIRTYGHICGFSGSSHTMIGLHFAGLQAESCMKGGSMAQRDQPWNWWCLAVSSNQCKLTNSGGALQCHRHNSQHSQHTTAFTIQHLDQSAYNVPCDGRTRASVCSTEHGAGVQGVARHPRGDSSLGAAGAGARKQRGAAAGNRHSADGARRLLPAEGRLPRQVDALESF